MAEPLSLAASIIAVLQLTAKTFEITYGYISAVKDANSEIRRLDDGLSKLKSLLLGLEELEEGSEEEEHSDDGADEKKETRKQSLAMWLEECKDELECLVKKLGNAHNQENKLKEFAAKIMWPLNRDDVERVHKLIEENKTTVMLGLGIKNL